MKKFALSVLLAVPMVLFNATASLAESLVEKNGLVFIADGGLFVKDLSGVEVCTPASTADLTTATDVVVTESEGIYSAIVTIHPVDPVDPESTITDFAVVDVTACYPEVVADPVSDVVVDDCYAYLSGNTLIIPCILHNDEVISAELTQNGNSHNWKASGVFKNVTVTKHHHDHDDDDDVVVEEVVVVE